MSYADLLDAQVLLLKRRIIARVRVDVSLSLAVRAVEHLEGQLHQSLEDKDDRDVVKVVCLLKGYDYSCNISFNRKNYRKFVLLTSSISGRLPSIASRNEMVRAKRTFRSRHESGNIDARSLCSIDLYLA